MKRNKIRRSPEGQQALDEFRDRWAGKPCWACGDMRGPFERHHIVYRDGIAEMDDQRNLAHLCQMCHEAHHDHGLKTWHGRPVRIHLTKDEVAGLKKRFDPEYFDLLLLRKLASKREGFLNMEFGRGLE